MTDETRNPTPANIIMDNLFVHEGGELRDESGRYVGASDEIVLRRDAEGAIELWLNGCLVYAD